MVDFPRISRRGLVLTMLGGGGVLGLGTALGFRLYRGPVPDVEGLRVLSAAEYQTVSRLAECLLPEGGAFPQGAKGRDLGRAFDDFLDGEPPWNREDLKRALALLELGPLLFERRLRGFSQLDEAERLAHFRLWAEGDRLLLRQAATAFRKFLTLVFYDHPEVWPHIGYVHPLGEQAQ